MIYIIDNFIDTELFGIAKQYLDKGKFVKHTSGGKNFYIQESPATFNSYVLRKLEAIEGSEVENILSFFRVSTDQLDTSWRIHSDLNIKGDRPDRAIVLYMSPREKEELHGTALWEHQIYGRELPPAITDEDYDSMIKIDAENIDMWRLSTVIGYHQNRVVSYPASYFHSKYPNKSWAGGREVFVMFYKYKKTK
mgnify:CR=1 FL=1|tara:strand:- start:10345 stop:10926 length:582 start_codon:yes stop_codon:yes gene_type:complete